MEEAIVKFLDKNKISVLNTLLSNGYPHGAALHYSFTENPFRFYFSVDRMSRKCENLIPGKDSKASLVIGFSDEEWKTIQLEGDIKIITNEQELLEAKEVHYLKNPGSRKYDSDPNSVFLEFNPLFYRYTDFNTNPVTVISSDKV